MSIVAHGPLVSYCSIYSIKTAPLIIPLLGSTKDGFHSRNFTVLHSLTHLNELLHLKTLFYNISNIFYIYNSLTFSTCVKIVKKNQRKKLPLRYKFNHY